MAMDYHYIKLANTLEKDIVSGRYRAGEKLPSLRKLHASTGRSISTVYQAYIELENRGMVEVREKSGFYARPLLHEILPTPSRGTSPVKPHKVAINTLAAMHQQTINNAKLLPFGAAIPSSALLPHKQLAASIRTVSSQYQNGKCLGYGHPTGEPELQKQIAKRSLDDSVHDSGEEIIITSGCMQAIDLCLRTVARPGDIILVESPTFLCYLQLIEDLNMRILEVPVDSRHGIDPDRIQTILDEHDVRAALFNPNFHNPLGCLMSDENKEKLVEMMNDQGVPIIEDDIYGELYFGDVRPRPLKSYDRRGMVLYCSSFSKTLAPDLRVGWVLPGVFREKVKRLKFNISIASSQLNQLVIADFLSTGAYDRHLRKMRNALKKQTTDTALAISRSFPTGTKISTPKGGYTLWVELPPGIDSLKLWSRAGKENISIFPGALCSGTDQYRNYIRISCGFPFTEELEQGINKLGCLVLELNDQSIPERNSRETTSAREIKIGLNTDPGLLRVNKLCENIHTSEPEFGIKLSQTMSGNILKLLASHELDGGFIYGDCMETQFSLLHLATMQLRIVGPVALKDKIKNADKSDIAALPWIGNPLECPYCQILKKEFHTLGLSPEIIMSADQESAITALIKAGVGLNFMLEEDARRAEKRGDVVVWENDSYSLPLSFVTLRSRRDDPRVRTLLQAVRVAWN
ncbi:MAG TPA: aminotransferase class I/II-fold pyridoxal phosphate-dependent enzyme [Desulfobulbus sp.]|nr:aminotransferase class I/II-fold pyridoxal phosphate-dependent enzyme [Desulfobulbus sp.]